MVLAFVHLLLDDWETNEAERVLVLCSCPSSIGWYTANYHNSLFSLANWLWIHLQEIEPLCSGWSFIGLQFLRHAFACWHVKFGFLAASLKEKEGLIRFWVRTISQSNDILKSSVCFYWIVKEIYFIFILLSCRKMFS